MRPQGLDGPGGLRDRKTYRRELLPTESLNGAGVVQRGPPDGAYGNGPENRRRIARAGTARTLTGPGISPPEAPFSSAAQIFQS